MALDLDHWLPTPTLRIAHSRDARAAPGALWESALAVRLSETGLLGRLIRWRIPGTGLGVTFEELFGNPPFTVLDGASERALVSGLVGRIWTLRRDYPKLSGPQEFRSWSKPGTARVLFAHWVVGVDGGARLTSEARVEAFGMQGRLGLRAIRPLVRAFHNLIGSDGLAAAVRRAEGGSVTGVHPVR